MEKMWSMKSCCTRQETKSDFQIVIERALGIACETLIPRNLENVWRDLSLTERYYLRFRY